MGNASSSALRDDAGSSAADPVADGAAFGSLSGLGGPRKFKKKPVLVLDQEELEKAHMMFQEASAEMLGQEVEKAEKPAAVLGLAPMDDESSAPEDMGESDDTEDGGDDEAIPAAEDLLRVTGSASESEQDEQEAALQQLEDGLDMEHRIFPKLPVVADEDEEDIDEEDEQATESSEDTQATDDLVADDLTADDVADEEPHGEDETEDAPTAKPPKTPALPVPAPETARKAAASLTNPKLRAERPALKKPPVILPKPVNFTPRPETRETGSRGTMPVAPPPVEARKIEPKPAPAPAPTPVAKTPSAPPPPLTVKKPSPAEKREPAPERAEQSENKLQNRTFKRYVAPFDSDAPPQKAQPTSPVPNIAPEAERRAAPESKAPEAEIDAAPVAEQAQNAEPKPQQPMAEPRAETPAPQPQPPANKSTIERAMPQPDDVPPSAATRSTADTPPPAKPAAEERAAEQVDREPTRSQPSPPEETPVEKPAIEEPVVEDRVTEVPVVEAETPQEPRIEDAASEGQDLRPEGTDLDDEDGPLEWFVSIDEAPSDKDAAIDDHPAAPLELEIEIDDDSIDGLAFMQDADRRERTLDALQQGQSNSLRARLIRDHEELAAATGERRRSESIIDRFLSWLRGLFG